MSIDLSPRTLDQVVLGYLVTAFRDKLRVYSDSDVRYTVEEAKILINRVNLVDYFEVISTCFDFLDIHATEVAEAETPAYSIGMSLYDDAAGNSGPGARMMFENRRIRYEGARDRKRPLDPRWVDEKIEFTMRMPS